MRSDLVLRSEDLEAVWYLLQRHAVAGPAGELAINYDDFSQASPAVRCLGNMRPMTCRRRGGSVMALADRLSGAGRTERQGRGGARRSAAWQRWGARRNARPLLGGVHTAGRCHCLPGELPPHSLQQVAAECRELVGSHTDAYFQASSFLRLARDGAGCVPLPSLFHYLAARSRQLQLVRGASRAVLLFVPLGDCARACSNVLRVTHSRKEISIDQPVACLPVLLPAACATGST